MFNKSSKGFSVTEVVVAIVIIGILGVAAVPSIQLVGRHEVKKFAKEMCLDITTQRLRAMTSSGANYSVDLVSSVPPGAYYTYTLSPAHISVSGVRQVNKGNSNGIRIIMQTSDSALGITTTSCVQFDKRGFMMNDTGAYIEALKISINYKETNTQIDFDGVTGNYKIK